MLLLALLGTALWILVSISAGLLFARMAGMNEHEEESPKLIAYPMPTARPLKAPDDLSLLGGRAA